MVKVMETLEVIDGKNQAPVKLNGIIPSCTTGNKFKYEKFK